MIPVKEWKYGRNRDETTGFLRHGVRYKDGRLIVPVDGIYFVYSMIDFFQPCNSTSGKPYANDSGKPIKHAIYRFNVLEREETEIIINIQPHLISKSRYYNSYSSYVSSLAKLKAGDEISVKVSHISYLRHVRDNNFGINLI